ncbi:MAG: hypothetical protein JSV12_06095 [Candidatus Bathyarchaeota archaeon]|nr:MAG: hypothetical protein JSV12_06095 [Candidatus Bathyarchaeota archaeon]
MTRIQKRFVKKRYYNKSLYQYAVYSLNFPKKFHEFLPAFLDKELDVDVQREGSSLTIILTPKLENHMEKTFLE